MRKRTTHAPRAPRGRQPAGRAGERVAGYVHQFSTRIPGDLYHLLAATNAVLGRTHWQVIEEALHMYLDRLSPADRHSVKSVARNRQSACRHCQGATP